MRTCNLVGIVYYLAVLFQSTLQNKTAGTSTCHFASNPWTKNLWFIEYNLAKDDGFEGICNRKFVDDYITWHSEFATTTVTFNEESSSDLDTEPPPDECNLSFDTAQPCFMVDALRALRPEGTLSNGCSFVG